MRTLLNPPVSVGRIILAAVACLALTVMGAAADAAPSERPGTSPVLQRALDARSGQAPEAGDVTLAMRDLALALPTLPDAEQDRARALLARPTDSNDPFSYGGLTPSGRCYEQFCLTWVTAGADAPSAVDSNGDGVPDWVDTTRSAVTQVLTAFERAGYRPPLPDAGPPSEGSTTQLDVYLVNLGDDGIYGYCVPDVDNFDAVTPGYCVLDNDFSSAEFGGTPLLTLGVTAAHELFHATQFAYDATEAPWFMESTATWMEDELVDDSNDNYQYLPYGPMGIPSMSLDDPDRLGFNVYGSWVFWRFLQEQLPRGGGPVAVRKTWELAGDGPGEPNLDGLRAVRSYVEDQGVDWASFFGVFEAANRLPGSFYEEGSSYPAAPAAGQVTLTPKHPAAKRTLEVNHLAAKTVLLRPVAAMRGKWSLRLSVKLPDRATDVRALVTVHSKGGGSKVLQVRLNAKGDGALKTNFRPRDIAAVAVTLVNGGTRYDCGLNTDWSCAGTSLDDGRKLTFTAKAVRSR
jgi:hypothetical protein